MSDDFLSRWSRRKRAGEEAEAPEAAAPAEEAVPEESDQEVLARLGLKHPDEMEPGDDFGAFLRAAVPRHLKTLAYRRLWRSNPALACLDGLNDYDGDFTGTGAPAGGVKTAYQVGRGLLGRIAAAAENHEPEVLAGGAEADPPAATEERGEETEAPAPEMVQSAESVQQDDAARATRRRMVFRTRS